MALSFVQYPGDGVKKDFQLTFSYLAKSHISVFVNGDPYPDFTFSSPFVVRLAAAPAMGHVIEVRRTTPRDTPLVDFVDGSTLTETDLDTATLQVFFLAQEAYDMAGGTLSLTPDGSYSASTRRIAQVGNPINAQDVVTKLWAETAMSSQLATATQKASDAISAANASNARANDSETSAQNAAASAATATVKASAAAQSEANALAYKNQTQLDRFATGADRVQTGLDREASAASAAAAKKSAEDAAMFDPSTYYTKVQIDGSFYTKTTIDTKLAGYATTAALTASADQKVAKIGDVMTGNLVINKPSGYAIVQLKAAAGQATCLDFLPNGVTGDYNWRVQAQPNNNEFDVFHNGGHRFRIRNDGHVWAAAYGWLSDRFAARGGRPYHDGGLWEFGSIDPQYADRASDAPSPYVLVGLRASRGSNIVYLRAIQLRNND